MMKYKVLSAAALSLALAMTPALARDGHGGRGAGMSHGAAVGGGGARSAGMGGSFRGAATGGSFRSGGQVSRGTFSGGGNRFAGGRGFRGDRRGGVGFGLAAGAVAGAALGGYYGGRYYGYDDGYYADSGYGQAYAYEGGDDGVGYCMQRYRSYDPNSGTFLGYDGLRHPCP